MGKRGVLHQRAWSTVQILHCCKFHNSLQHGSHTCVDWANVSATRVPALLSERNACFLTVFLYYLSAGLITGWQQCTQSHLSCFQCSFLVCGFLIFGTRQLTLIMTTTQGPFRQVGVFYLCLYTFYLHFCKTGQHISLYFCRSRTFGWSKSCTGLPRPSTQVSP